MATKLKAIVSFLVVAPGATVVKPHGLNYNDLPLLPDIVFGNSSDFAVVANDMDVTVTNNTLLPSTIRVLVEHWHTIERDFGDVAILDLNPQPYYVLPATGGITSIIVEDEGVVIGTRPILNFIGVPVTAVDNPPFNRIDITISAAQVTNNPPTQIDIGDTAQVGVSADAARADHQHALPAPGPPQTVTGPTNAAGGSTVPAREDHQHRLGLLVDDEAVPVGPGRPEINFKGAGVSAVDNPGADRVDITITAANLTNSSPTQIDIGDTAQVGIATDAARADHQHALPAPGAPATVTGPTNSGGASTVVAREDHQHRLGLVVDDEGVVVGPGRPVLNFIGAGVTAVDNPGMDQVDITIPGSSADATAVLSFGEGSIGAAAGTRYLDPWFGGKNEVSGVTILEVPIPRAGTVRNLFVRHNTNNGNTKSVTYIVLKNGVVTALAVILATGAIGQASDLVDSFAVIQGDRLAVQAIKADPIGNGALEVVATMELA